jgi:ATP-dependent DNA helicase RecQ
MMHVTAPLPRIAERALAVLRATFGYPAFRGPQQAIVEHVADGGDALVLMPTGGGKSLCYQVPSLLREGTGIVVSPLIALMQDQVAALTQAGVRAAVLNSTLTAREARDTERALLAGELDLLYVAPERLCTDACLELLAHARLALFAIDEAHCVSQWGHDFRPEYLQLSVLHERFPEVPRIALTATADPQTREEIIARLALQDARVFVSSFDRPNIRYTIVDKRDPRTQLLRFIRDEHAGDAGIVYCLSRRKVDETAQWLVEQGVSALPYHAGMDTAARAENQARFQREDGIVMVATIAFGMGIDKPDVRFVAHLDLPKSIEGYYQETGRAGRDGAPADAWMAYGLADVVQQRRLIEASEGSDDYKRVSSAKLDALLGLCETAGCRRVRLLDYFGEPSAPCGNCDTCLHPPETWDATVAAQKALSCIYRTGQRFGAMHLIDVLLGRDTERTGRWGHDQLSVFGVGKELDEAGWRSAIRQLVALGLVRVDHDAHGALKLTEASREVLRGGRAVQMRREVAQPARKRSRGGSSTSRSGAAAALGAGDTALFDRLKTWRLAQAREQGVPAYVILHDATLAEIARQRPDSLAGLGAIGGIGERKLDRYGAGLLEVIGADA